MLIMQDIMDTFFNESGLTDKGTLCHLRNLLGFRNVTKDVGSSFNHVSEFLYLTTVGYTILLAMTKMKIDNINDIPQDIQETTITDIAEEIVSSVWTESNFQTITDPETAEQSLYEYCYCAEDKDEEMRECSGPKCISGKWFHLGCINMRVEEVPDDNWYCRNCEAKKSLYPYCICYQDKGTGMIACDNPACEKEWFHLSCVDVKNVPAGSWYCSKPCKDKHAKENPDRVKECATSLLFHGLLDLAKKRENDGPMMVSFWKWDLVPFFNRNHTKYVILAHRLIAGVSGWLPPRLAADLTWNRTVNFTGGPGRHIEMDLANELLNKEFKHSLRDAGGNITKETVARHSQLVGHLGKTIDGLYGGISGVEEKAVVKSPKLRIEEKLTSFLNVMQRKKVFVYNPGRKFKSFPDFHHSLDCKNPKRLHAKLKKLSKRLDRQRKIVHV